MKNVSLTKAVGFAMVFGNLLAIGNLVVAACPQQRPKNQACMPKTSICAGANPCIDGTNPVSGAPIQGGREQQSANGPFGCQDNTPNNTECVTGLANQTAACYTEQTCIMVGGQGCVPDPNSNQNHTSVIMVQDGCGPIG